MSAAAAGRPARRATIGEDWISFHVFYHGGSLDRLLAGLVRPTVERLSRQGHIAAFFFVRYWLGGPHVRLRLLPRPGCAALVRRRVQRRAADFLRRHPSPAALSPAAIREANRALADPEARGHEDLVGADNSCREVPFEPEVERYGGPDLLPHSLDFFALSSCRALQLLPQRGSGAEAQWLSTALRMRVRQVLGFAAGVDALEELAAMAPIMPEPLRAHVEMRADQMFEGREAAFVALLAEEAGRSCRERSPLADAGMAYRLSWELRRGEAGLRGRIQRSHLHMTANRLGLRNVDEVCLSRILWRSARAMASSQPARWAELRDALARRSAARRAPRPRLHELVPLALASTFEPRAGGAEAPT
ncbi:MAG TPA: lantibiotic dehydratase C-terminal domain-containing protein [Thermoanaerobaculia bacterium]